MRLKVLVVDDEPLAREGLRLLLGRQTAVESVSEARNGREAVAIIRERTPDLVLLDVQMPRMDGVTATRCIRQLDGPGSDVPIIAMTANALPEQVRAFRAAGMDGHIAKPFKQQDLHDAIRRALDKAAGPPGAAVPASAQSPQPTRSAA